MKKFPILFSLFLCSCGVYKNSFDCPPGRGIGCAPVGEVLDLIVEKKEGEDLFIQDKGTALLLRHQEKEKTVKASSSNKAHKKTYLVQDEAGNWKLIQLHEGKNS